MTVEQINIVRKAFRENAPLIHCITNPISINQCANAVLAIGGRPIMAEHPREVEEITRTADALLLNLGNITDARMASMMISAKAAVDKEIPFVVDLVGIACSKLRRDFASELMQSYSPTIIKGNYSEINALYSSDYKTAGVDADLSLNINNITNAAVSISQKCNCIVLASGETDIVACGKKVIYIKNGSRQLASVTGTGCMLGVLCSCYLSVCTDLSAAAAACAVLGICGEISETERGIGSFMTNLLDSLSSLTDAEIINRLKTEEKEIENI